MIWFDTDIHSPYEHSPFIWCKSCLRHETRPCLLARDLKHLCHTQTDLKGNNLCVMAAPPPYQPLSNTETRSREEPWGTPTGSTDCGPSPSFNCLALSSLKRLERGRDTKPAAHMHSWSLLQTRQKHLGTQQFHDIIIFSLGCLGQYWMVKHWFTLLPSC